MKYSAATPATIVAMPKKVLFPETGSLERPPVLRNVGHVRNVDVSFVDEIGSELIRVTFCFVSGSSTVSVVYMFFFWRFMICSMLLPVKRDVFSTRVQATGGLMRS